MGIAQRYTRLRAELDEACRACGRDPREVLLLPVSKTVGVPEVREAMAAGALDFGENRPDCIVEKQEALPQARWHFIGNVQSRRIRDIVSHAHLVHSLFEERHLAKVDAAAAELGKVQDVLLEVNVSGEASKSGFAPTEVADALRFCGGLAHVRVRGLMTMAPQGDLAVARDVFAGLSALRDELQRTVADEIPNCQLNELSMGMSEDWREAVPFGATIVRIGRAVFDDAFEREVGEDGPSPAN